MTKHVILLTDKDRAAISDILDCLESAGIAVTRHNLAAAHPSPGPRWSSVLCAIGSDATLEQLRQIAESARHTWPHIPLVACRCYQPETYAPRPSLLTDEVLKKIGFRAVADTPAQLPALLRQLEDSPATGELKPLPEFERRPSCAALSLPPEADDEQARGAFRLTASLHLAKNQNEAGQIALAGLGHLVVANCWSIFLVVRAPRPQPVVLEHLVTRSVAQGEKISLDNWESEDADDVLPMNRAPSDAARTATAAIERVVNYENFRVIVALPLLSEDIMVGVLEGIRNQDRPFSDSEIVLLEKLAIPIAAALQNSVRIADAERLSHTDDLTQLHNARYLRQFLVNETKRARRYNSNLAAVFLDLDDFKQINDLHGHLVGSHVLMEVASLILPSVRDTDCVVRYGGDEFVVILPETALDEALQVAERIRAKLERHSFSGGRRLKLHLTASFGVAVLPQHASSPQQLIAAADTAMYEAKAGGKNCLRTSSASRLSAPGNETPHMPSSFLKIPDEKLIS